MKRKLSGFLTLIFVLIMQVAFAQDQTKSITGTVTDENEVPLPNADVTIEGTSRGTVTDFDGEFTIEASSGETLKVSLVGFEDKELPIEDQQTLTIVMKEGTSLSEVVVTALGVSREKRSLGYATEEVDGGDISTVKTTDFTSALSGRVTGLNITKNNNFGGSTNAIIRGYKSLTGNNQALFVVDGVPISNRNTNSDGQSQAVGNYYDYGNAATDINPEDIESVNVLKGAAATALYGSRAANGAIIITTKKGKKSEGLGITINSGFSVGFIDDKTWPTFQNKYGGGYSQDFKKQDVDGDGTDDLVARLGDDASLGPAFDPDLMVYQWDAFVDPEDPNFGKATPWVPAEHGPKDFFENPVTVSNSIAISNGYEDGAYRISYGRKDQYGLMPNSKMHRNDFKISGNYDLSDKLHVQGFANYMKNDVVGRNSTGYNGNIAGMFRQWFQTNVDMYKQRDAYRRTQANASWNPENTEPGAVGMYWDNPYFKRNENFQNDTRNRFIGKVQLQYDFTDWFNAVGRITTDYISTLQEERRAVGTVGAPFGVTRSNVDSGYLRRNITEYETNYDLMLNFDLDITDDLDFHGILGSNIRRSEFNEVYASTAGGLLVPGLYSLQNGVDPAPNPEETLQKIAVDGFYASASFGYQGMLFLDATIRRDHSSTLPTDDSKFWYPSVSSSFVFSELLDNDWLSFGKVRLGYAQVGNDAPFDRLQDTYVINDDIGTSLPTTKNNAELKPEKTKSWEAGLEMNFLDSRLGFDFTYYHTKTVDEIMSTPIPTSTGYSNLLINAGEMQNQGVEIGLTLTPVKTEDWSWNLGVNFTKNKNEVLNLPAGINTIQLGSFQGGVTLQAEKGEPFGIIRGTDYVYDDDGNKVVDPESGLYEETSSANNNIGDTNPDWLMGITSSMSYKNWSFNFLIDMQHGGDVFSLDQFYGEGTGLYPNTAFINDKGNPVRKPLDEGGGFINPGVNPDGSQNTTRVDASKDGAFGYSGHVPRSAFVYDASYIKLRSLSVSYDLPSEVLTNTFLTGLTLTLTGQNLWIIHKNIPYADPEAGLSSGNRRGYITGAMPTTRNFGFNVMAKF